MYQSFWHKVPLVRILLAFLLGIGTSMFYAFSLQLVICVFVVALIAYAILSAITLSYYWRWLSGLAIWILFFGLGVLLHLSQNQLLKPHHFSFATQASYYVASVEEEPIKKRRSYKMRAAVVGCLTERGELLSTSGNLLIYLSNDSSNIIPKYGDVLLIPSKHINVVPGPKNPEEFNYKRYLAFNHIHHQCYLQQATFTGKNVGNRLFKYILHTQHYFTTVLQQYIQQPEAIAIMQALLYGYDDEIDDDTMSAYANTGTLHVLAVSGMHVGIIFYILNMLLFFMNKNKRLLFSKRLLIIACLWAYSALCGLSPSILRATVMFNFIIIADMLNRKSNIYNTLAASCFSILCFDTNTLANVGFQLSYMAVLGIVFLQPLLYQKFIAQNWVVDQIWKITTVSIAAQITTSPIGILYFHQFPNCFLFSNLLIIPLTTMILYGGIILLVLAKFTFIATWLGKAIMYVILFTNWLVKLVEQIPYSYVNGLQISISQSVLLYLVFLMVMGYVFYRNTLFIQSALLLTIAFFAINSFQHIKNAQQQHLIVYSIKRDNAIHLVNGKQSVLILDSALRNDPSRFHFHLQQHIWWLGIEQLDTLSLLPNWQLVQFKTYKLLISGNMENTHEHQDAVDLFIIRNPVRYQILHRIKPKQVVLSGSLRLAQVKKLQRYYASRNIACHSVLLSGAFQW